MPYQLLADVVLVLHFGVVVFIVAGLLAVFVGKVRGWRWVAAPGFRWMHLAAIAVVVVQAWLGRVCPLTTLESWLRTRAGETSYTGGFVEQWVGRVLFYDAPPWLFTLAYTAFGALVLAAWRSVPPRRARRVDRGRRPMARHCGPRSRERK